MAVWSCWILAGTGKCCRIHRSRASQTCSMGDISGEYAGHARTGMFSASRNCVKILATWGCALSCCNMRWWPWMNGTTMGLRISSRYLCALKMPSIQCTVLCDKTAYFKVALFCGQPQAHLCNNHDVKSASWYATPVRWMDYLGKGEVVTNTDLDRFVNNIWEK